MPDETDKVVVIHLKPGVPVKIGETTLTVKRWRDGKVTMELIGPEEVRRPSLTEPPVEA